MNLYLLEQAYNRNYDTYDSCVVVAADAESARLLHPRDTNSWHPDREQWGAYYTHPYQGRQFSDDNSWAPPEWVKVTLIGYALMDPSLKPGTVVCASFNAG